MPADAKWYVVHTYSGYEDKVATNIEKVVKNRKMEDQILEVKIPIEEVTVVKPAKKKKNKKSDEDDDYSVIDKEEDVEMETKVVRNKILPGYVFIKVAVTYDDDDQPSMSDDAWFVIRHTRGVTGFVGPDSKPAPLSDEEVYKLGVEKHVIEVNYKVGDRVAIIDGIFDGFTGVVEEIDTDNSYVKVKVSALFGKETLVELALDQVVVAED